MDAEGCIVIAQAARRAAQDLAATTSRVRNAALLSIRDALLLHSGKIRAANAMDLETAAADGLDGAIVKVCLH